MKQTKSYYGKLVIDNRLPSSINGNPRYAGHIEYFEKHFNAIWLEKVPFVTAPDASIGYAITNYDGKLVSANIGKYPASPGPT